MENDKLKQWLDFGKFFLGTFLIGFVSLVVKTGLEGREIAIKESEQIGKYVEIALREDVGVRKRFAEYFKTVSVSDQYRDRWSDYFTLVNLEFEKIENKAKDVQQRIDSLNSIIESISDKTNVDHQGEIDSLTESYQFKINNLQSIRKSLQSELSVNKKEQFVNDPFIIGLYSLRADKSKKDAIKKYLKESNFYFDDDYDYSYKQSWMANESTVFYYSKESKIHAAQIASDLQKITGMEFESRLGAGLGVSEGKESITFFIHYIN